jgi:tRNA (uracil-5-)-methyltransferase TRM9
MLTNPMNYSGTDSPIRTICTVSEGNSRAPFKGGCAYDHIALHFNETRKAIWSRVGKFLDMIPKYSLVADVGCGNGKYTRYRQDIFVIANDICIPLLDFIENNSTCNCCIADGLYLPYKTKSFQYAISIAVLHHISDYESRLKFITNIINILEPGGKLLFTVWAVEQTIKPKWIRQDNDNDYLIPWLDKYTKQTFYRFYHLFSCDEINQFVNDLENVVVCNIVFEKDNWYVELQAL